MLKTENDISEKDDTYFSQSESRNLKTKAPRLTVEFNQIYKLYAHKLNKLSLGLEPRIEKFWQLLEHNSEGEIEKKAFLELYSKFFRLILPIYNWHEIQIFLEGEWILTGSNTWNYEQFAKYLFSFVHTWSVHVNSLDYSDFLDLIYERTTKWVKTFKDGSQKEYNPCIKSNIVKIMSIKEYQEKTWEKVENNETVDRVVMETPEGNMEDDELNIKRPFMHENYIVNSNFIIYNEEVFYENEETFKVLDKCETLTKKLINDEEVVILGLPTQYILSDFKNNLQQLQNFIGTDDSAAEESINMSNIPNQQENNTKIQSFKIEDFRSYSNKVFYFTFDENCNIRELYKSLEKEQIIILSRDILSLKEITIKDNYIGEISIFNNLRRNNQLDRILNFQKVTLQNNSSYFVNVDNLIISSSHRKALENLIVNGKIGVKSTLWTQKIQDKVENIIKNKFALIHNKLLHFLLNASCYSNIINEINFELKEESNKKLKDAELDLNYFKNFESKLGIERDSWDTDYDIIKEAKTKSPVILVIGKPLIGKTSVSKKLAEDMNMVYLDPEKYFANIFTKVAKYEEDMQNWDDGSGEPNDDQGDDAARPKKVKPGLDSVLYKLEEKVYSDLMEGREIPRESMFELYKNIIHSDLAYSRGLVIDLHTSVDEISFANLVLDGHFGNLSVDYVVNLVLPDEELLWRKNGMMFNLKTLQNISKREIQIMKKPKTKKKELFEDEEVEEEGEAQVNEEIELSDEMKELIPTEKDLLKITNFDKIFAEKLKFYEEVQLPRLKEYYKQLKSNYYIQVDTLGLDYDEVTDLVRTQLENTIGQRYIAKSLEAGDYKDLLMNKREGILPYRKWSLWKQTDPVALKDEFLILNGLPDFAVEYYGKVFLFTSEENKNKFLQNPKKYLDTPPEMPKKYRVCILGPPKSGKNTVADLLSEIFGWKKINLQEIYDAVKEYQKKIDNPENNNVYATQIHFSNAEYKEIITPPKKGEKKQENFTSKIVFMLDSLGIKLDKKRTYQDFLNDIEGKEIKLQHLFNKLEKQRQKALEEEEKKNLDQEFTHNEEGSNMNEQIQSPTEIEFDPYPPEDEYIFEDIRSDQFYYAYNIDGTIPRPGGFIVLNCPSSLEEVEKFKDFNIVFDKVIYLVDQSEEPLKALALRKNPNFSSLDEEKQTVEIEKLKSEVTKLEETLTILKEKYNRPNEECLFELNCVDTIENIKLKLIQGLNPFYLKVDAENFIISNADINLEEKAPIQKGEFGNFCPVTYKNERWLYHCTEEFEVQVNGRKYRLASQIEQDIFRKDPSFFLTESKMTPVNVPPPHIFFTGFQGGGVSHFTSLLSKEFKLRKRELKSEFMQIWNTQSSDRKQIRINKKREELIKKNEEIKQSNSADPTAEPQELINIDQELQNDPTLEEEEEGFNPVENDKNIFKRLFQSETASVYDSTWFEINEKIQTALLDFLVETRRVPNIMVILRLSLKSILERHLNIQALEEEHKRLTKISLDKKNAALEKLIQDKKEAKLEELKNELPEIGEPEINPEDINQGAISNKKLPDLKDILIELTQDEQDEIMLAADPDLPDLSTLINAEKEKLVARFESNNNFLTGLTEQLKEKLIPVIEINNDSSPDMVYKNLLYELKPYLLNRVNLIEQQLVTPLPELNLRKTRELSTSEVYSLSSWGNLSPVRPEKLSPRTNLSILYRDKLYFFNNEQEKRLFSEEPLTYRLGKEFPRDLSKRLLIYTIGLPRSGKSTLANMLESLGFYRLTVKQATSDLLQILQSCLLKTEIEEALYSGRSLDDLLITKIIERRISLSDLICRNVIIDGFPLTLQQADLITNKKNCRPNYIFYSELKEPIVLSRMKKQKGFDSLVQVINERFINSRDALKEILSLFIKHDYDIKFFNMEKSLWYCKDLIIDLLENRKKYELNFISKFNQNQPALLNYILPKKILRNLIYYQGKKNKLSLYSPVSYKMKNEFWYGKNAAENTKKNNIIYYKDRLHLLRNEEELNLFVCSPFLFENILEESKDDIIPPKRLNFEHISSITHVEPTFEMEDNESIGNSNDPLKVITKRVNFEYQACCPIAISEDKQLKEGQLMYVVMYIYRYYRFESGVNLMKFLLNPQKYFNMVVPVKKTIDHHKKSEAEVDFENTVNYLETNFASLITKGMLELSKNRIKFPYISVKETSIKYLALFLKANNPNNSEYAKTKYKKKFEDFLKNSKIPFDLMNVYENHMKENNTLKKQLIRKQLNNLADKYDDLMDKAKTLTNTRFENFFKSSEY
jgi:adenylate/nucleoside-diphosphate kinase